MEIAGIGALIAGKFFTVVLPLVFLALTTWMSWRIMVKAGFPGYLGLFNIMGIIPVFGSIIWLILLWVFAFIQWPRDGASASRVGYQPSPGGPLPPLHPPGVPPGSPPPPALPPGSPPPQALPAPPQALPAPPTLLPPPGAAWTLVGTLPGGAPLRFAIDESRQVLTIGAPLAPADLTIPDPSVGAPHARLHILPGRIGLEDLGSPGGTWIDGAQLTPANGIREITHSRELKFGALTLTLARA